MANITKAWQWAVNTCNADNVGYSQDYRNAQVVNGITYYDCSSFIWYALKNGGFKLSSSYPFSTGTMRTELKKLGFKQVSLSEDWKPGDIAWRTGHTEMVYSGGTGKGVTMGAHNPNVSLENQVSIGGSNGDETLTTNASDWESLWRYGTGGAFVPTTKQWIYGSSSKGYLSEEEQQNNAEIIYSFFYYKGWTINAVAGLCGNIQPESTFNPALIETGGTGHGLVQWTPPSNLYDVLDVLYGSHEDWSDGDKQLNVLYAEYQQATGEKNWGIEKQWYATSGYPLSYEEFAHSTQDAGYLALAFQHNYERPGTYHDERADYARKWYNYLLTINPSEIDIPITKKKGLKVWQMVKYHL